ncbi:hypothetical protein F5Y08DRAFT_338941 [Xylaria arbuscula]|nr:hypothetical protein F5Y08DRAFT_338941 [Xylaria arbuscula]
MFPIGIMFYFGTNLDERFAVPEFWPKPEQANRVPLEKDEIHAELQRLRTRRLYLRDRRLEAEAAARAGGDSTTNGNGSGNGEAEDFAHGINARETELFFPILRIDAHGEDETRRERNETKRANLRNTGLTWKNSSLQRRLLPIGSVSVRLSICELNIWGRSGLWRKLPTNGLNYAMNKETRL